LTNPDAEVADVMTTLSVDAARKVCEIGTSVSAGLVFNPR